MSTSLIISEALLSLYPVLIKSTNSSLVSQTFYRLITATLVCYPFISISLTDAISNMVSLVYMVHIFTSYVGFQNLEVGTALTLFYTYPIINVILNRQKAIDFQVMILFLISFIGIILIGYDYTKTSTSSGLVILLGISAIAVSAVSESLIYTLHKNVDDPNPFNMLFKMCLLGSVIMGIIYALSPDKGSLPVISAIVIINVILGVVGYLLKFYSATNTTTEWFSILSFTGIIFGYIYGYVFYGENITLLKLLGTSLIVGSVYGVKMMGY